MNDTLPLNDSRDKIKIVTGERGKGMSTLAFDVRNERRTRLKRMKEQLIAGLRWYDQNSPQFFMVLNTILAPMTLFLGLFALGNELTILAAIFITSSSVMFIVLGAAMIMYAHGRPYH